MAAKDEVMKVSQWRELCWIRQKKEKEKRDVQKAQFTQLTNISYFVDKGPSFNQISSVGFNSEMKLFGPSFMIIVGNFIPKVGSTIKGIRRLWN